MTSNVVLLVILFGAVTTQVTTKASGASSEDAVRTEIAEAVAKSVVDVVVKECDVLEVDVVEVALKVVNAAENAALGGIVCGSVNGASISTFATAKAISEGIAIAIKQIAKIANISVDTTVITASDLAGRVEEIKQGAEFQGQGLTLLPGADSQVFVAAVAEALVAAKDICKGGTVEAKDMVDVPAKNQKDIVTNLYQYVSLKRRALLQTAQPQKQYNGKIVQAFEDSQGISVRFENTGTVATSFQITLLEADNTEIDSEIFNNVRIGQEVVVGFPTAPNQGTSLIPGQSYNIKLEVFDKSTSGYRTVEIKPSNQKSVQGKLINTEGAVIQIDDLNIKKLWPQEEAEITIQFNNSNKALILPDDAFIKDTSSLNSTKVSIKFDNIKNDPINYFIIISPKTINQKNKNQLKKEGEISAAKEIKFTFMTQRFVNVLLNVYQDSYIIKLLVSDKDDSGFDFVDSSNQTTPIDPSQQKIPVYQVDGKLLQVQDTFRQDFVDINVTFQNNGSVPAIFYVTLKSDSGEEIFEKTSNKVDTNSSTVVSMIGQSRQKLGDFYTVYLFVQDILNDERKFLELKKRNVEFEQVNVPKLPIKTSQKTQDFSGTINLIDQITRQTIQLSKLQNFTVTEEIVISVHFNNSGDTFSSFKLDLQSGDNDVLFSETFEKVFVGQQIVETFTTNQNISTDKLGDTYTVILYVFNRQSNKYQEVDSQTLENPLQQNSN